MKKRDLENKIAEFGWYLERHGANHDVWTNGEIKNFIPRHREVSENLARGIIKIAQDNPAVTKDG